MFERFTAGARDVVRKAREEALRRGDGWIGTEHLLIGLLSGPHDGVVLSDHGIDLAEVRRRVDLRLGRDIDGAALSTIGIDLDEVRRAAEAQFGAGALEPPRDRRRPRFTRRAKKVLELSLREAVRMKQDHIRAGHLLLGMLSEGEGLAVQVLVELGVDVRTLREDTELLLADRAA